MCAVCAEIPGLPVTQHYCGQLIHHLVLAWASVAAPGEAAPAGSSLAQHARADPQAHPVAEAANVACLLTAAVCLGEPSFLHAKNILGYGTLPEARFT